MQLICLASDLSPFFPIKWATFSGTCAMPDDAFAQTTHLLVWQAFINRLSYFGQTDCHISDKQTVIFRTNRLSYFGQTDCHILDKQTVIFRTNRLSYIGQTDCHILDKQTVIFGDGRSEGAVKGGKYTNPLELDPSQNQTLSRFSLIPSSVSTSSADLLISMHQHDAQVCGLQASSSNDGDVVALTDVVDVDRYAGISADAVLLHEWNQLTLCQVVRGRGLFLDQLHLCKKIKSCSFFVFFYSANCSLCKH